MKAGTYYVKLYTQKFRVVYANRPRAPVYELHFCGLLVYWPTPNESLGDLLPAGQRPNRFINTDATKVCNTTPVNACIGDVYISSNVQRLGGRQNEVPAIFTMLYNWMGTKCTTVPALVTHPAPERARQR